MKFSCTQENLLRSVLLASRISTRAGNLPILTHLHIKAEEGGIFLKATNLEMGISVLTRGKVEEFGEYTVPARLFGDYLSSLPKEKIEVSLLEKEGELQIRCAAHLTKVKGTPAQEFPLIPPLEEGEVRQLNPAELQQGLEQVLFAISPTETRQELSGALLILEGKKVTLVGTDSYRLAEKILTASGGSAGDRQAIVPLRALQELSRLCAFEEETGEVLELLLSAHQFGVRTASWTFVSRLIEGQYPEYRAILPAAFGTQAEVAREELLRAIKIAGLFSKTGVYDVVLDFKPAEGVIAVQSLNSQTGEESSLVPAEVQGAPARLGFNWRYLLAGLEAFPAELLTIQATDPASPALFKGKGETNYFYLVMPIKE